MAPGDIGDLGSDVASVSETLDLILVDALMAGAMLYSKEVQRRTPIKTGQYRSSIRADPVGSAEVGVGSPMPQIFRLEYGFVGHDSLGRRYHQAPRPHWRPAFDATKGRIASVIQNRVSTALKKGVGVRGHG